MTAIPEPTTQKRDVPLEGSRLKTTGSFAASLNGAAFISSEGRVYRLFSEDETSSLDARLELGRFECDSMDDEPEMIVTPTDFRHVDETGCVSIRFTAGEENTARRSKTVTDTLPSEPTIPLTEAIRRLRAVEGVLKHRTRESSSRVFDDLSESVAGKSKEALLKLTPTKQREPREAVRPPAEERPVEQRKTATPIFVAKNAGRMREGKITGYKETKTPKTPEIQGDAAGPICREIMIDGKPVFSNKRTTNVTAEFRTVVVASQDVVRNVFERFSEKTNTEDSVPETRQPVEHCRPTTVTLEIVEFQAELARAIAVKKHTKQRPVAERKNIVAESRPALEHVEAIETIPDVRKTYRYPESGETVPAADPILRAHGVPASRPEIITTPDEDVADISVSEDVHEIVVHETVTIVDDFKATALRESLREIESSADADVIETTIIETPSPEMHPEHENIVQEQETTATWSFVQETVVATVEQSDVFVSINTTAGGKMQAPGKSADEETDVPQKTVVASRRPKAVSFRWPLVCDKLKEQADQQIRSLADHLEVHHEQGRRTISFHGFHPGEGCTTLLLCTVRELTNRGFDVLLVDGNPFNPDLPEMLEIQATSSVTERVSLIPDRLDLLPWSENVTEINFLGESKVRKHSVCVGGLKTDYDFVFVDSGALTEGNPHDKSVLWSEHLTDGVLLVINTKNEPPINLDAVARRLAVHGVELLGVSENYV